MEAMKKLSLGRGQESKAFCQGFRHIICNNSSLLPDTVPGMHMHTINLYNYYVQKIIIIISVL